MTEEHFNALPAGYGLFEYEIKSVLGHGGFGITYLAWDKNLEKEVAIKEYLPAEFAVRRGEQTVRPRSTADQEDYQWGLERFVKEAQTLALFRHPSIVPVFRFFEANGTAYMVMEYQKGESLSGLMRKHRGEFTEDDLLSLAVPLLDGLSAVHKAGYLHRDVKPGNIFIREDGSPVLLDFGAARDAVGRKSKSLTSIVTPGYAPLEQYFADGNQGPWTDIYALAAILYQAVTGKIPPEAPARVKNDPIKPCAELAKGKFGAPFLAAIDRALTLEEEHRPQTTDEWRDMLEGRIPATAGTGAAAAAEGGQTLFAGAARRSSDGGTPTMVPERSVEPDRKSRTGLFVGMGVAASVMFFGAIAGAWYLTDEQGFNAALGLSGTKQIADKTDSERRAERRRQEEADRLKREEGERKRQADEAERNREAIEAERRRKADEAERKRKADEAERKRQAEHERQRREREAERRRLEAEKRKRDAELDKRLGEDADQREAERKRKAEAARKAREDQERRDAEAARKAREDRARRDAEAARKAREDQERRKAEAERKAREDRERRKAEAERKRREDDRKRRELASRPTVRCSSSLATLNPLYKSATDCIWVRRVRETTLRQANPGITNRWRNSRTGNSGTFTVLGTYKKADGTYCRRFRQTVTSDGVTRQAIGTACFVNQRWRVGG